MRLFDNQLSGTLPIGIGSLVNLKFLLLHNNKLHGDIKNIISDLKNLEYLDLHSNQFSGQVPLDLCKSDKIKFKLEMNRFCPPYPKCLDEVNTGSQYLLDCK